MVYYFGGFPPPYGGVTIKNKLLTEYLEKHIPLKKLDTLKAKKNPFRLLSQTAKLVFCRKGTVVVATSSASRRRITMLLARLNPARLKKAVLMVMGGRLAEELPGDEAFEDALKQYRQLFVETESLRQKLLARNFTNVSVYPNCRVDNRVESIRPTEGSGLKCCFFSLISPEKGVDTVLEAAARLPGITVELYGELEPAYQEEFLQRVAELDNVSYHGVFRSDGVNIYGKLHEYDALLLPTRYKNEGVPGILVEAKIAGVPSVVSDHAYNREIVEHDKAGVVLEENSVECLARELDDLSREPARVDRLKQGALDSARDYLIETYIQDIISYLR